MSGTSWLDWEPEAFRHRPSSLEDRASVAFKIVALLNLPGIIVSPWGGPPSWLLLMTSTGAATGLTLLWLVEAVGIDRRRSWALRAIRPLLVVVVAFGLYSAIAAFEQGWWKLPLDAALATWAWLSRPGDVVERGRRETAVGPSLLRAGALVVAAAVLEAVIWYGPPVFGWGGFLDVHQRDLTAALQVDCGPPGAGPPASLTVTYDWSWRSEPAFPSGLDEVVVGWRGTDGQGHLLYLLGDAPDAGPGVRSGLQDVPSRQLAEQVEAELPAQWHWGLQLDHQAMRPGRIELRLDRATAAPAEPGPLTITATYIHLGLWRQSPPSVTCSW